MMSSRLTAFNAEAADAATKIHHVGERGPDEALLPDNLKVLARRNGFAGEAGGVLVGEEGALLGIGDESDPFVAAAAAEKLGAGDYAFSDLPAEIDPSLFCIGWLMGGYVFDRYKTQKEASARLVAPEGVDVEEVSRIYDAVRLARDLVNTPAGDMTPEALADEAAKVARECGAEINVIVGDDLLTENFPMIHAVGRAAASAPRLVDLRWGRADAPKVTLVGKGVTFDSGGLNMKGASGMLIMKKDMGGAAHALALGRLIMQSGLDVRLRVLVPAVENAVSGGAFRPGDILKSRKGLTVEIGNTDAEGRLILGDALALGAEENPDLMISLATLTGAARVALGPEVIPFYTDDDAFALDLMAASEKSADPVWRMPLWRNYEAMLSSAIADCNHISGNSFAGSIVAALFLKKFVSEPWVHFDLYAWRPKAAPGRPMGGEAQAIRALYKVLRARYGAA